MTWFMFSLISITALATAEILQQKILNKNKMSETLSTVLTFGLQSILSVTIIFLFGYSNQLFSIFDKRVFPYFIASTILATYGTLFYFKSFKVKNISISAIFTSFSAVVSTILGIVMIGESTDILKYIGIGLVLTAIIILNINNITLEKNHFYGLLAGIFFGSTFVFDKLIVTNDIHPLIYLFWSFTIIALIIYLFNIKDINKGINKTKIKHLKPIFISGIGYLIYNLCTFTAYSVGGEVGKVDAINNSQIFLIIVFEYFILKQKDELFRKVITAIIAFIGVLILGYF